jgi:DNA-directed RNA polymerase subunit RPC12/RpoP
VWFEEPERVELDEARAYYRCSRCEATFLIRWDDAVALGVASQRADQPVDEGR